jgi:hypothetical protein
MQDKPLYISRQPSEEELYTELQRKTLDELQRLSGEIWTDFNPHDPGVTVADVVNYALTEMDYKLDFDLEDYLTDPDGSYPIERYGLLPARRVYPTNPVTSDDYRKLMLAYFPMVEQVTVTTDPRTGSYDFTLSLSPFFRRQELLEEQIRQLFHKSRNLCETIGKVVIKQPEELSFHAELEIYPGTDATDILAQIYLQSMQYMAGSVQIKQAPLDDFASISPEKWFDGPLEEVGVTMPEQKNTESELYWLLCKINGIKSFKTCYFIEKEKEEGGKEHIRTDFKKGYTLQIPDDFHNVVVKVGDETMEINVKVFKEKLKAYYFTRGTSYMRYFFINRWDKQQQQKESENSGKTADTIRHAHYRNIFEHYSVAKDLPICYKTGEKDLLTGNTKEERAAARNFGNYLTLFDLVMERGLLELDQLKKLLSLRETETDVSTIDLLPSGALPLKDTDDRVRDITALKNQYMDFLDGIYGVDSNPKWMKKFEYYGDTESACLKRRMRFLRALPELVRNRSKAANILEENKEENIPTIKKYISLLLNLNSNELISAGNILPSHNLILMRDDEQGKYFRDLMSSALNDENISATDTVFVIDPDTPPATEYEKREKNEELRRNLSIFNSNWISGTLFREGIFLNNYKLVKLDNREYLLVFQGQNKESRINLGRSSDAEKLKGWANTLRRYLQELNRQCEVMYVIEKNLFEHPDPFTVMFVFSGWTARTKSLTFREFCTQLIRSLLPAHLKMEIYWITATQMQYFEKYYNKWRDENHPKEVNAALQEQIIKILSSDYPGKKEGEKEM